ncbi:hypothetical protein GEMRC1_004425 [Eukaryota sp. GEM-RC1]
MSFTSSCKLFISDIPSWIHDDLFRKVLISCGSLKFWKRVRDAEGTYLDFGIAEYPNFDDVARAYHTLSTFPFPPAHQSLTVTLDKHDALHLNPQPPANSSSIKETLSAVLEGNYNPEFDETDPLLSSTVSADGEFIDPNLSNQIHEFRRIQAVHDVHLTERDRMRTELQRKERDEELQVLADALGVPSSDEPPQPRGVFLKVPGGMSVDDVNIEQIARMIEHDFPLQSKSRSDYVFDLHPSAVAFIQDYDREQRQILSSYNNMASLKFLNPLGNSSEVDKTLGPWSLQRQRHVARERADDLAALAQEESVQLKVEKEKRKDDARKVDHVGVKSQPKFAEKSSTESLIEIEQFDLTDLLSEPPAQPPLPEPSSKKDQDLHPSIDLEMDLPLG